MRNALLLPAILIAGPVMSAESIDGVFVEVEGSLGASLMSNNMAPQFSDDMIFDRFDLTGPREFTGKAAVANDDAAADGKIAIAASNDGRTLDISATSLAYAYASDADESLEAMAVVRTDAKSRFNVKEAGQISLTAAFDSAAEDGDIELTLDRNGTNVFSKTLKPGEAASQDVFADPGTYELKFSMLGMAKDNDIAKGAELVLSNVKTQVRINEPEAIPTPMAAGLGLLGLAALSVKRRRRG